ncbi:30S ribosomal protein S27e [Fervidicoccus fontis]|uniref:Small ribosomal subunit protein eS27 n=2 Tax=Fervidicoccus fontis TaxID=683846 RepID=I0A272_FERFK|nr:30S ribosomal protein S27e [Fervidicoccus fontis]AFH43079.1 30S ribosomal protein S27e [Fervidicoccus fontis Kam940]MBE9391367.1 30S ribosomal protein S27e [Fervidicoccus fontis]PMB75612.1 MAG: 30S ribosomal protein S27e [Fervidicoccus fontis]HEW64109.1 30S ribosomal protein S27e [Fervidicoccus fontis]
MTKRRSLPIPEPRTKFILVRCPACGNEQVIFSHATFPVRCLICGSQLVKPTGGRARLQAQFIKVVG